MRSATRLGPLVFFVSVIVSVGCGKLKPSTASGTPDAAIDGAHDAPIDGSPDAAIDSAPDAAIDGAPDAVIDSTNDSGLIDSADAVAAPDGSLADGPDADARKDAAGCSLPITVGCFSGDVCASPRVETVCVDGQWTCPSGSHGTEIC